MLKIGILLSFVVASTLFTSCGSADKNETSYQCPMKCEGTKTYDKPGDCPVCGMELQGVEQK